MTKLRRRTRLLIARRFQMKYISLILVLMFATVMLTGYMVYVTTWIMFGEKLAAVYPQGLLLDIVQKVNMVLLLRMIFLSPLVILIGLVLSNRIAGPIYRIQRFLHNVTNGHYETRLKLREKDELQDLAESLNFLVSKLRSDREGFREAINDLKHETDSMEAMLIMGDHNREILLRKTLELRKYVDKLKEI